MIVRNINELVEKMSSFLKKFSKTFFQKIVLKQFHCFWSEMLSEHTTPSPLTLQKKWYIRDLKINISLRISFASHPLPIENSGYIPDFRYFFVFALFLKLPIFSELYEKTELELTFAHLSENRVRRDSNPPDLDSDLNFESFFDSKYLYLYLNHWIFWSTVKIAQWNHA